MGRINRVVFPVLLSVIVGVGCASPRGKTSRATDESELEELMLELDSKEEYDQFDAATEIREIGPAAKVAVPKLVGFLKANASERLVIASLRAIENIGEGGRDVDEQLIRYLEYESHGGISFYHYAQDAFKAVNTPASIRASVLIAGFEDCNTTHQQNRCYYLAKLGPAAKGIVPKVLPLLNKPGTISDGAVISLLAAIGPEARQAIPDLLYLTESKLYRRDALYALKAVGKPRMQDLSLILFHLKSRQEVTRVATIQVLSSLDKDAKKVMSTFIKLLDDPSPKVREEAVRAIGNIGPDAKSVLPKFNEMKKSAGFPVLKAIEASTRQINGTSKGKRSVA
ncbi:MAG: hypothetical protein P1V97_06765 [Planctomycetota bacterium]|nr:hypothetical protein [Planctomycetota bacterium]